MKTNRITKALGALLLTGLFAAGNAIAAESAAGVKEFMALTVKSTKEAQAAAAAGDEATCSAKIKETKQNYKEITGDAAGKPLQDAMKKVRAAQAHCDAGNAQEAAPLLGEAAAAMEKVQATIR